MTSIVEVLREHEIGSSEAEVAAELRILLDSADSPHPVALTADEEKFLAQYGGVPRASRKRLAALEARSTAAAVAEAADSLSRSEVADLLDADVTRISHRTREGSLYSYAGASGRRRYPSWQFHGHETLPHLSAVIARLPRDAHPVTVRSFMTAADDALLVHGKPVSPAAWLASGGDVQPVAELAETLGELA